MYSEIYYTVTSFTVKDCFNLSPNWWNNVNPPGLEEIPKHYFTIANLNTVLKPFNTCIKILILLSLYIFEFYEVYNGDPVIILNNNMKTPINMVPINHLVKPRK